MNDEVKRPWLPSDFFKKVDAWVKGTQETYQKRMFTKYAQTFPTAYPEASGVEVSEAWKDVLDWWKVKEPQESFQKKPTAEKNALRMAYFEKVVLPKAKDPEEATHLRKHFEADFADSFLHGMVSMYTGMSDRFLLPPRLKPEVPVAQLAGHLAGALPVYMIAGKAVSGAAMKGVPTDIESAARQLALAKGPPGLATPSVLRTPTFTGRGLHGAATFALAEMPAIAGGAVPLPDLLKSGLYGMAFGGPKTAMVASLLSGVTAGTLEGPEAGKQMALMTGFFRGFGLVTPHLKEGFTRSREFAAGQLDRFVRGYVERSSTRSPVEVHDIPTADAIVRRSRELSEGITKVQRDMAEATQESQRLGLPEEELFSLRTKHDQVMQARRADSMADLLDSLNKFYGELDLLADKLSLKFTRSLEDSELRLTMAADARIREHPTTPTGRFLTQLRSHPIRLNSDIHRLTDDVPNNVTKVSELDKYLAKQIVGKGRSVTHEQLQDMRLSPDELPELVRTMRDQNLLSTEPIRFTEPPVTPTTVTWIYYEALSYLPRHRVHEFATRMKDLVGREEGLPDKVRRKLWLEFEKDINTAVREYAEELTKKGRRPEDEPQIAPEEVLSTAEVKEELLRTLANRQVTMMESKEGPAADLKEQMARESRARVEADRIYEADLAALKGEVEPSAHEQMTEMLRKVGAREADLYSLGFSTGSFKAEGVAPGDNPYQIALLLERKGLRGRWDSKQQRLWVQEKDYEWKETSVEALERMPDAGETTTTGELVITLHADENFAIVKRGDTWKIQYKAALKKQAEPPQRPYRLQRYPEEPFGLKEPSRPLWELEYDYSKMEKLSELHDRDVGAFWEKLGPFPEGWTPESVNEALMMFGEFRLLSPKRGALTDRQVGRSLMQMFEAYSEPGAYIGKEDFPQRIKDFTGLASLFRQKGLLSPRAVTPFKEGLFHKGSVEALIAAPEYGPAEAPEYAPRRRGKEVEVVPLTMEQILDLMYAQGYTIEWRQPDGGLFYTDLYNGQRKVMFVESIQQLLKNPRDIPDFTPELKIPPDPTSYNPEGRQMPTDPPPPRWAPLISRWIEPRKVRFDAYERIFKIPIRQVWRDYEALLVDLRKWVKGARIQQDYALKTLDKGKYWEAMEYIRSTGGIHDRAQLAQKLGLSKTDVNVAEDIRDFGRRILGRSYDDLMAQGADYLATGEQTPLLGTWMRRYGWRPEYLTDFRNHIRNLSGTQVRKMTRPFVERLSELMKDIRNLDITNETKGKMIKDIRRYRDSTVAGLVGDFEATSGFIEAVNKKFGLNLTGTMTDKLTSFYLMSTYASTMPFRIGLVSRNFVQPVGTTGLVLGTEYLAKGYVHAFTDAGKSLARELKITEPEVVAFQEALPRVALGLRQMYDIGMKPYFGADKLNRAVSASAAYLKMRDYAPKYLRGELSLRAFLRESGLVYSSKTTQQEVLFPLTEGTKGIEAAAKRFAYNVQEDTQWIYRAGNAPWAFEAFGRWGRLAGQFGIWPASYVQFFRRGIRSGDPLATAIFLRRWATFNTLTLAVGLEVLGVDIRNWVFLGPLSYAGGPGLQALENIRDIMGSLTYGEWRRDMALRDMKDSALTMIPFRSAIRDRVRMLQEEEVSEAIKRYFGLRRWPVERR